MKRRAVFRVALFAAALLASLSGGARGLSGVHAPRPQERAPYKLTGEEGMVEGVVSVVGVVPPRPLISMASDAACVSQNKGETRLDDIVVERGRLANALVYVESAALEGYMFEPRWVPALGKRRCRTVPRVLAMQAGQTLYVQNGDRTTHNYSFQTKVNPLFNKTLLPRQNFEISFLTPEPPFAVQCNQHPWERGHVAVLPHPFFAVTGRGGTFAIEALPPGEYEVVLWHEKFKEARAKVTVGARATAAANFTLKFPADQR